MVKHGNELMYFEMILDYFNCPIEDDKKECDGKCITWPDMCQGIEVCKHLTTTDEKPPWITLEE